MASTSWGGGGSRRRLFPCRSTATMPRSREIRRNWDVSDRGTSMTWHPSLTASRPKRRASRSRRQLVVQGLAHAEEELTKLLTQARGCEAREPPCLDHKEVTPGRATAGGG